jgi:hypothetical protein
MAALIGYLTYGHHAGTIHRLAHKDIRAKLATWNGDVSIWLDKDGLASCAVNGKEVWHGNVNKK